MNWLAKIKANNGDSATIVIDFADLLMLWRHPDIIEIRIIKNEVIQNLLTFIDQNNGYTDVDSLYERAISVSLEKNNHNITRTASELGISKNTLYRKIQKYGLN